MKFSTIPIILRVATLLAATAAKLAGQSMPGLYLTNAVLLSNGCGQIEVRTPEAAKPYALLYSYAKDFCYLSDAQRWGVVTALTNSATNSYVITLPEPMSSIGTIFFRVAPLGQPVYWLEYSIYSSGKLTNDLGSVTWPKQPDGWDAELTVQNSTNFPVRSAVLFTGPPGSLVTKKPAASESGGGYEHYYRVSGFGTLPPAGTWLVQYADAVLTFPMLDPQVSSRYVVMLPQLVVSNGLLTSVSWTYRNAITGAILAALPDFVAASKSVTVSSLKHQNIYDSPPAERARTNHVFSPPVAWGDVGALNIGFHDSLGNEFGFSYHK